MAWGTWQVLWIGRWQVQLQFAINTDSFGIGIVGTEHFRGYDTFIHTQSNNTDAILKNRHESLQLLLYLLQHRRQCDWGWGYAG